MNFINIAGVWSFINVDNTPNCYKQITIIKFNKHLFISKSQGQICKVFGIYLRSEVFSHGQIYVTPLQLSSQKTKLYLFLMIAMKHEIFYDY